jgi:hypothetical protein
MGKQTVAPTTNNQRNHMRYLKLIAAATMAIAAITAATATAALAAQAGGFLPKTTFIGTSEKGGKLETAAASITCAKANILSGTMETDSHGTVDIHYEKCTAFGLPANSLGDASEVILGLSLWLYCRDSTTGAPLMWIEPSSPVHIEVPALGQLLLVTGGILGKITPEKGPTLKTKIAFEGEKGKAKPTSCIGMDGKTKTVNQTAELNENKKPEGSNFKGEATIEASDKKTEVEIMNGI